MSEEATFCCGMGWPTDDGHAINCLKHERYGEFLKLSTPTPPSLHPEPIQADREAAKRFRLAFLANSQRTFDEIASEYFAAHRLAFSTLEVSDAEGLKPVATAPKDGTWILAQLAQIEDERWSHLSGRHFVIRHEGETPSGYDMGWGLFPGMGGVPDLWIAGWMPLPKAGEGRADQQADDLEPIDTVPGAGSL